MYLWSGMCGCIPVPIMFGAGTLEKNENGFTMDNIWCGPCHGGCLGLRGSWQGKAAYVKQGGAPTIVEIER